MPKHVLFICKSCQLATPEKQDKGQSDGNKLLNQLLALHQDWSRKSDLEIQAVECLWACSHPCVVAFSTTQKFAYLFTDLPPSDSAVALLQFGEYYLDSDDGNVLLSKFPEVIKSAELARIPPVPQD